MFNGGHISSLAVMLLGIIVIIIAAVIIIKIKRKCSVKIKAVVSDISTHHDYNSNKSRRRAKCTFEYSGKEYCVQVSGVDSATHIGDKVTININPEKPEQFYRGKDFFIPIFFVIFGAFMIFVGFIYFIISFFVSIV